MSPMSPRLLRPRSTGFHPEAQAWRNAVIANGGTVSGSTLTAVSKFCFAIDAAGIRDRFFRLNLFCGDFTAALVPLFRGQSRTGTQYGNTTDTNVNFVSGDYVETGSGGGLVGNGTTKGLRTGVLDSSAIGMATSAHISSYVLAHSTSNLRQDVGNTNTDANTHRCTLQSGGLGDYQFLHNSATSPAAVVTSGSRTPAMYVGTGQATTANIYKNGTLAAGPTTVTQRSMFSWPFHVFAAANSANTLSAFSNARLAAYSFGPFMTDTQVAAFYTAMQAFQTSLGRNV